MPVQTERINLVKSSLNDRICIFRQQKKVRGTSFRIFSDQTIEFKGSSSTLGVLITSNAKKWVNLPNSKNDFRINVIANYEWENENEGKNRIENLKSEIVHDNYTPRICPIEVNMELLESLRNKNLIKCEITGIIDNKFQLNSTDYFKEALRIRNAIDIPCLNELTLVTSGGQQNATFEIFQDENGGVFISSKGIMDNYGDISLSSEIGRYIENWFGNEELFLAALNNEMPIIIPSKVKVRTNRVGRSDLSNKLIRFPYFNANVCEKINVVITNPNLKLSEKAISDYKIKENLIKKGISIDSIKTSHDWGRVHIDSFMEQEVKKMIFELFNQDGFSLIFNEVEIAAQENNLTAYKSNRKKLDMVVIPLQKEKINSPLLLIEIKSSSKHSQQTKETIAEIKNLQEKLGCNVIPIVFINYDIKGMKTKLSVTEKFGELNGVILIGKQEFSEIKETPSKFNTRLTEYMNFIQKRNNGLVCASSYNENIVQSIINFGSKNLLEKLELFKLNFHYGFKIEGFIEPNSNGQTFEVEVKEELENEGFQVISNLQVSYKGILIEFDHVAFKGDIITIVSCKDRGDYMNSAKLAQKIKIAANVLEHRQRLFKFANAILYVKVKHEKVDSMKNVFTSINTRNNLEIRILRN